MNGQILKEIYIGIGCLCESSGITYPSPLSLFVKHVYGRFGQGLNTQRVVASEIVKFLNFCKNNLEEEEFQILKEKGISGLDLIHGAKYITYQTLRSKQGEIESDYVYRMERFLIKFYKWLLNRNIITMDEFISDSNISPFNDIELGTLYPKKLESISSKLVDFGEDRIKLVHNFLLIAEEICPDVALGFAFQFFGGLRRSEVVNLVKDSFSMPGFGENFVNNNSSIILKVRDNQDKLFLHLDTLVTEQVKKPRDQMVLPFNILKRLIEKHKNELKILEQTGKIINKDALFIDKKTGLAINGQQYNRRFNKVKMAFLKFLSDNNYRDFDYLNDNPWSTHIGRGVFTNIMLDQTEDVIATVIARGDKTLDTVLDYIDRRKALKYTQSIVKDFKENLKNEKELIEEAYKSGTTDFSKEVSLKVADYD